MKRLVIIIVTLLVIFVYGILIPIVPITSYLVFNQEIVRLYPSNSYLMDDSADFESYMNGRGWSFSHVEMSTWFYVKGEKSTQFHVTDFYRIYESDGKIVLWHDSAKPINHPKMIVIVMVVVYYMAFVGWFIYLFVNRRSNR